MAGEQVVKAGFHDVIGALLHAKIGAQRRAGPGHGTGLRQHGALQRGEVADADELRAVAYRARYGGAVDAGQDAGEAVAPARDQGHVGATGGRTVDGSQARGVVACKAGVLGQGVGVDFHLVPQGLQAFDTPAKGRLVTYGAGG